MQSHDDTQPSGEAPAAPIDLSRCWSCGRAAIPPGQRIGVLLALASPHGAYVACPACVGRDLVRRDPQERESADQRERREAAEAVLTWLDLHAEAR